MFAPAPTLPEIVSRIDAAIVKALAGEEVKEKARRIGWQPTGTTPDELGRAQRDAIARGPRL